MMKRLFGILLSLLVVLAVMPISAHAAVEYDLWVCGVRVTDANKDAIPAFENGTAHFAPATNTLTLTDAYSEKGYYKTSDGSACAIYTESLDLTVIGADGFNLLGGCDYGVYAQRGDLTLKGNLNANCDRTAFYAGDQLTVSGGVVQGHGSACGFYGKNAICFVDGAEVRARALSGCGVIGEGTLSVIGSSLQTDGKSGGVRLVGSDPDVKNDAVFRNSKTQAGTSFSAETCTVEIGGELTIDGGSFESFVIQGYAVKAEKITLGDGMQILTPKGGALNEAKTTVLDPVNGQPATDVLISAGNEYPLWVAGVQVTNDNRADLAEILAQVSDANMERYLEGTLEASFDGVNTLHIAGDIDAEDDCLIRSQLAGLVISVDEPSYLSCTQQPCLQLLADAVITGERKLTLASSNSIGIEVGNGACLTLEELTLNIRAKYPISAGEDPSTAESLDIVHSYVHAYAGGDAAIAGFKGGITLTGCYLSAPSEAMVRDGGVYEGTAFSKTAVITPAYVFTCGFENILAEPGVNRTVPWSTNFIPKKVTVINSGEHDPGEDPPERRSGFVTLGASDAPYMLRAYYGDGAEDYVNSREFYITEQAEKVSYPIRIGGVTVTSENRKDLGEVLAALDDGNMEAYLDGSLTAAFDGCRTLTLSGSAETADTAIFNNGIAGLTVIVEGEASLTSTQGYAFITQRDAVLTGGGKLTLKSSGSAAVYVAQSSLLTVQDITLTASGDAGITGSTLMPGNEMLLIDRAEVTAAGSDGAIFCFGGGIALVDCELKTPEGGDIAGGEAIDGEGWRAKEAHIAPTEKPDDPFLPYNGKIGDLDGDRGITASDARLALRMAVGLEPERSAAPAMLRYADVDGSGAVNAADARLILRRAVGFIDPEWIGTE